MRRGVGSKNRKTTPATTSTTPVCQLLGSTIAGTTPPGTRAAAAVRTQRPDTARAGQNCPGPREEKTTCPQKHNEAGGGRLECGGEWAAKTEKHPPQQPAQPQYASYWAPLTRKRHQQEHRPQQPTECSDPAQHAKGRTNECRGPCNETATRWNVTPGGWGGMGGDVGGIHCHGVFANKASGHARQLLV